MINTFLKRCLYSLIVKKKIKLKFRFKKKKFRFNSKNVK